MLFVGGFIFEEPIKERVVHIQNKYKVKFENITKGELG